MNEEEELERREKTFLIFTFPIWLPPLLGAVILDSLPNGRERMSRMPAWCAPLLWPLGLLFPFFIAGMILFHLPQDLIEHFQRKNLQKRNAELRAEAQSKIPLYRRMATQQARKKNESKKYLLSQKNEKLAST